MRLLLIEDDLILLDLLLNSLLKNYIVDFANNLEKITNLFEDNSYQAVLLSSLVFSNHQLRNEAGRVFKKTQAPVLLMTNGEVLLQDFDFLGQRLIDFLHKPFTFNELNLRLSLMLFQLPKNPKIFSLSYQKLILDNQSHQLFYEGKSLCLTKKEFCLLQLFFKWPNQLLSKSLLANLVWDNEEVLDNNSIATHLSSLRRKIKKLSGKNLIKAVRGDGYLLKN